MKYCGGVPIYICLLIGLLTYDRSSICKKCSRVFAHSYTLDDDKERNDQLFFSLTSPSVCKFFLRALLIVTGM